MNTLYSASFCGSVFHGVFVFGNNLANAWKISSLDALLFNPLSLGVTLVSLPARLSSLDHSRTQTCALQNKNGIHVKKYYFDYKQSRF